MRDVGKRINSFGVILKKVIASQSSGQNLFLIKSGKGKRFKRDYAFGAEKTYLRPLRLHLTTWTGAGSLTVGPPGPLVRFDQSPASSPSSARVERGSGDHRRRTVAPFGKLRPPADSGGRGGHSGSRRVVGGGGNRRRRAPRRREASVVKWF